NLQKLGPGYFRGYHHSANNDALVFIDNPATQRENWEIMTYKNNTMRIGNNTTIYQRYNYAVAFMLAWPYGVPRVMSSYYFNDADQGPPSAGPAGSFETSSPTFNEDLTCEESSGFVCEHRWPLIREMTKFRSVTEGAEVTEVVTRFRALAFARKGKGFFAITESWVPFTKVYQTTLPEGQYCDVWTGYLKDGACTGKTITIGSDGTAEIPVYPVVAISLASKIGYEPGPDPPVPTHPPGPRTSRKPIPTKTPGPQPPTEPPKPESTTPRKEPTTPKPQPTTPKPVPTTPKPQPTTAKPKPPTTPEPLPPTAPPVGYSKTVILLQMNTRVGEYVFVRGGTSHLNKGACAPSPYQQETDKCAIPIKHTTTVPSNFLEYIYWSQGDNYLDFAGPERSQGLFNGRQSSGTPLAYSSNNPSDKEYQPYNKYGRGYWIAEIVMDCSKTDNGWFEMKGFLYPYNRWENDIHQGICTGSVGGSAPFQSINHIGKCGAVNVFHWGNGACTIDAL
ncbi:unnamed protein product, partial [Cylicocyclus nassatus]